MSAKIIHVDFINRARIYPDSSSILSDTLVTYLQNGYGAFISSGIQTAEVDEYLRRLYQLKADDYGRFPTTPRSK